MAVGPLSKVIKDRGVLLLGTGAFSLVTILILMYTPWAARGVWWAEISFVSSVAGCIFFMPFMVTGAASVLSRSVPPHRQATVQGLRSAFERCGMVLGPLLAAHALNWNLFWVFFPAGMQIMLLWALCFMSKDALTEEALVNFAAGAHTRKLASSKLTK